MKTTRELANAATPNFRRFLRDYCVAGGSMRAEAFAEAFAMYCLDRDDEPVSQKVLITLLDRLGAASLYREAGGSKVSFSCSYTGDRTSLHHEYGPDLYDFDPVPPKLFNLWEM